jgi:DnaJ-class molecular chaperone
MSEKTTEVKKKCPECYGAGTVDRSTGLSFMPIVTESCSKCNGTGKVPSK